MNIVVNMICPFLIPSVFAATGWTLGFSMMIASTFVTYSTGIVIGEICQAHPELHSYPELAGAAGQALTKMWHPGASEETHRWAGRTSKGSVVILQFLVFYLTGITQLVYLEQFLSALFPAVPFCQRGWLSFGCFLCWPFMQIPSYHEGRWVGLATLVMTFFSCGVCYYELFLVQPWNCEPGPIHPDPNMMTALGGLMAAASAFGVHGFFPEIIREMEDPSQWKWVMRWSYAMIVPIYLSLGTLGYYGYGKHSFPTLQLNAPNNLPNRISNTLMGLAEIYWTFGSMLVLALNMEIGLGVDPGAWCRRGVVTENSCVEWLSLRRLGVPPGCFRLIFRSVFLGSGLLLTQLMLGSNSLFAIQAVTGAIGVITLSFVVPVVCGWALLPRRTWAVERFYHLMIFVVFSVLFFFGLYSSLSDLFGSSQGFSEVTCHYYGYTYYGGESGNGCGVALGNHNGTS